MDMKDPQTTTALKALPESETGKVLNRLFLLLGKHLPEEALYVGNVPVLVSIIG